LSKRTAEVVGHLDGPEPVSRSNLPTWPERSVAGPAGPLTLGVKEAIMSSRDQAFPDSRPPLVIEQHFGHVGEDTGYVFRVTGERGLRDDGSGRFLLSCEPMRSAWRHR
jgi:hypothetical protein